MPTCIVYATVGSTILDIAGKTPSKGKFQKLIITTLLIKLHRQGCQNTQLKRLLNKLFGKHFETFKRFADTENISFNCFNCFDLSCGSLWIKLLLISFLLLLAFVSVL